MDYRRFYIGQPVAATATMSVLYNNDSYSGTSDKAIKRVVTRPCRFTGQIIGLKRFYLGEYSPSSESPGWGYNEEPSLTTAFLSVSDSVVAWIIRTGMFNKPKFALDAHVTATAYPLGYEIPILSVRTYPWSEENKANLREEMAKWPRDAKGRWLKENQK